MKSASLLQGPAGRAQALGRAGGNGRRATEYLRALSRVQLGSPGRCPDRPGLFLAVSDDSGSVCGGNDPLGHRYDEIAYALRKVSARCTCHRELVSIIHFDVPTDADVPATILDRRNLGAVLDGLRVPSNAASSNLGPALDAAYRVAAQHPEHQATLLAATDFELFDPDIEAVLSRLIRFPGKVHALVLNNEPPPILTGHSHITVSRVDPHSTIGAIAANVFATVTANRRGAMPAAPTGTSPMPGKRSAAPTISAATSAPTKGN